MGPIEQIQSVPTDKSLNENLHVPDQTRFGEGRQGAARLLEDLRPVQELPGKKSWTNEDEPSAASDSLGQKALRIGQVSVEGVAYSIPGAWHALKHDLTPANWGHTGMKILAAASLGAAMRVALSESSAIGSIAKTAMAVSFLKDAAAPVVTAWKDVWTDGSDSTMNLSARNLGESLGAFMLDSYISGKAAEFAGRMTPILAERYLPRQWAALESWKNRPIMEKYSEGGTHAYYGIGITAPKYNAFRDGVLDLSVDTGHVIAYLRDRTGEVTDVISFGPDTKLPFDSAKYNANFLSGRIHGKGDWPVTDPVATYEWKINEAGYEKARSMIQAERTHPPNYLPFHACPAAPIEIGRALGLAIPSGVSDVYIVANRFVPAVPAPNPYGLQRQLNAWSKYPLLDSPTEFQAVNAH